MKKIAGIIFAAAMILSVVFIDSAISNQSSMAAFAQNNRQVTVRRKKRGVASRVYRGGKYVYRKGRNGTVYVYRKTKSGTVYVGKKTYRGTKYVGRKVVNGTKSIFNKTKKVID